MQVRECPRFVGVQVQRPAGPYRILRQPFGRLVVRAQSSCKVNTPASCRTLSVVMSIVHLDAWWNLHGHGYDANPHENPDIRLNLDQVARGTVRSQEDRTPSLC